MPTPPLPEPPPPPPFEPSSEPTTTGEERRPVAAVLLVVVVLSASAVVAWAFLRPTRCSDRTFVSERLGYCVDPPGGWVGTLGSTGRWPMDSFVVRTSSATVEVAAVRWPASAGLAAFADQIGELDRADGLLLGDRKGFQIDGEPALYFEAGPVGSPEGGLKAREVLVVRNDVGWRITLADKADAFARDLASFQSLLDSWRFR